MRSARSKKPQPRRDVFTQFPATGHASLIVRYAFVGDDRLAYSFAETADRLVSTFTGSPSDDAMLLPYLYLYRHAMELELKQAIRYAARLRRAKGDDDPDLAPEILNDRLKNQLGHRLMALVEALDGELKALDVERTPSSVRKTVQLLGNADKMGVAFRYSGTLPDTQDNIDFGALTAAVQGAYRLMTAVQDVLSAYEESLRDFLEYEDEMRREHEGEMRREYEQDFRAEFEGFTSPRSRTRASAVTVMRRPSVRPPKLARCWPCSASCNPWPPPSPACGKLKVRSLRPPRPGPLPSISRSRRAAGTAAFRGDGGRCPVRATKGHGTRPGAPAVSP